MSMTTIAFFKKAKTPTKTQLESEIEKLDYDFKFLDEFESLDQFGGTCKLNGKETFFETYVQAKGEILDDFPFLNKDLSKFDCGISFIWGADFIAGACIGIIATALIDLCESKIVYVDDETWYTRQMLLSEIPIFLEEHEKQTPSNVVNSPATNSKLKKKIKWADWVILGLLTISIILMSRKLIGWHLPAIILVLYISYNIWSERTKR